MDNPNITPPDSSRLPVRPEIIEKYHRRDGEGFTVTSPLYLEIRQSVLDEAMRVIEAATASAGVTELPDVMRLDMVPTDSGVKIVEINADSPGATLSNIAAHLAFGENDTAEEIQEILESSWGINPTWLIGGNRQRGSESDAAIGKDLLWGDDFKVIKGGVETLRGREIGRAYRCYHGAEAEDFNNLLTGQELSDVINTHDSWKVGNNGLLSDIKSPLLPKAENFILEPGTHVVPDGVVWKKEFEWGGKGVFFPGEEVEIPKDFADGVRMLGQQMVKIKTFDYKGLRYKFGIDAYLVKDRNTGEYKAFFMSRTCDDNDQTGKLNISQKGGGLTPVVGKILPY